MRNRAGRHSKFNPDILAKLEEAFLCGHSDEEACIIAQINPATLYRYCQKNGNFARRKEMEMKKEKPSSSIPIFILRNMALLLNTWD